MSIENVERLVFGKARREAESLLGQAEKRAEARLERGEAELGRRNAEEVERYRRQLQEERDRELASRVSEHSRELLAQRNELLRRVRDRARERIAERPQPQYHQWLRSQLRQLGEVEQGQLVCRGDDRELISKLLEELSGEDLRLDVTVSSEELAATGGFIVRCPEYDVDVTLESQLQALWEEVLPEVVGRLFGQGGKSE